MLTFYKPVFWFLNEKSVRLSIHFDGFETIFLIPMIKKKNDKKNYIVILY